MPIAGGTRMQDLKLGDVLLYKVAVREKGTLTHYYGCDVVSSLSGGRPLNVSGEPVTGVRAIYRRNATASSSSGQGRVLLARHENESEEKPWLSRELGKLFGPGELVTGLACQCEAACGILKKCL
jgi:hypothetical protein